VHYHRTLTFTAACIRLAVGRPDRCPSLGLAVVTWRDPEAVREPPFGAVECPFGTAHRAVQNAVFGAVAVAASTCLIAGLLRSAGVTMLIDVRRTAQPQPACGLGGTGALLARRGVGYRWEAR
jgi:hypothetical protein